jgi:hypothetical protein
MASSVRVPHSCFFIHTFLSFFLIVIHLQLFLLST